jgi:HlyD family secretion protein
MNNIIKKTSASLQSLLFVSMTILLLSSCKTSDDKADAYGNFEATEVTISSETNGKIMLFTISEGQKLEKGTLVAEVDSTALVLKRNNLLAAKKVIYSKSKGVLSQINVLKTQKETAMLNKKRIEDLLADKLASQKQLDDVNGQINAFDKQMASIQTQNAGVLDETQTIDAQIAELNHQIAQCKIYNPVAGTVLVKYAEAGEMTGFGKPLYKIANLDVMQFKGYISETQLSTVKVGQKVEVSVDAADALIGHEGTITWIASEAEFTPKVIQTKEERVNLVYAIKVDVKNDGSLKIGMPGEMRNR